MPGAGKGVKRPIGRTRKLNGNGKRIRVLNRGGLDAKGRKQLLALASEHSQKRVPIGKYRLRYLEVLMAAAKIFSEKGYHLATTTEIAEELGVHQSTLYYYLKSKEQALEQICAVAIEGYVGFSEEIRKRKGSVSAKVRDVMFQHIITIRDRPSFFKVFQSNRKDLGAAARHGIGRKIRRYESNVEAILKQAATAGAMRTNVNTLHAAMALIALCNSVSIWWPIRSAEPIERIADELAEMFLAGIFLAASASTKSRPAERS